MLRADDDRATAVLWNSIVTCQKDASAVIAHVKTELRCPPKDAFTFRRIQEVRYVLNHESLAIRLIDHIHEVLPQLSTRVATLVSRQVRKSLARRPADDNIRPGHVSINYLLDFGRHAMLSKVFRVGPSEVRLAFHREDRLKASPLKSQRQAAASREQVDHLVTAAHFFQLLRLRRPTLGNLPRFEKTANRIGTCVHFPGPGPQDWQNIFPRSAVSDLRHSWRRPKRPPFFPEKTVTGAESQQDLGQWADGTAFFQILPGYLHTGLEEFSRHPHAEMSGAVSSRERMHRKSIPHQKFYWLTSETQSSNGV